MKPFPLVSVGMPIFNEERFLRASLDALTEQDYVNIEIIISDNASTDHSETICRDYAERFAHVTYHRFAENKGPGPNFAHVLKQARGEFFMWASGHDLWAPNYLSSCVDALTRHEDAVLAFGTSKWIDENGVTLTKESGWTDTRGMDVVARYITVLWGNMHPILGLIRTAPLREVPFINMVGADLVILTRLALQGDFVHSPLTNWSRREFRNETTFTEKLSRYKNTSYRVVTARWEKLFPLARLPLALVRNVLSADLPITDKTLIMALLVPCFPIRYITGRRYRAR
ncbi:MAG: glycosyltransferase family 2 protein [Chromatiales bacterium]|nr:glycosyltransferase family 2 protein [Chromatiales bacterium]